MYQTEDDQALRVWADRVIAVFAELGAVATATLARLATTGAALPTVVVRITRAQHEGASGPDHVVSPHSPAIPRATTGPSQPTDAHDARGYKQKPVSNKE